MRPVSERHALAFTWLAGPLLAALVGALAPLGGCASNCLSVEAENRWYQERLEDAYRKINTQSMEIKVLRGLKKV